MPPRSSSGTNTVPLKPDESASRKRERDEEEEEERKQKELDDALLAACEKGSLDDVKKALTNGGFRTLSMKKEETVFLWRVEERIGTWLRRL
jgi:hypothetical protein